MTTTKNEDTQPEAAIFSKVEISSNLFQKQLIKWKPAFNCEPSMPIFCGSDYNRPKIIFRYLNAKRSKLTDGPTRLRTDDGTNPATRQAIRGRSRKLAGRFYFIDTFTSLVVQIAYCADDHRKFIQVISSAANKRILQGSSATI